MFGLEACRCHLVHLTRCSPHGLPSFLRWIASPEPSHSITALLLSLTIKRKSHLYNTFDQSYKSCCGDTYMMIEQPESESLRILEFFFFFGGGTQSDERTKTGALSSETRVRAQIIGLVSVLLSHGLYHKWKSPIVPTLIGLWGQSQSAKFHHQWTDDTKASNHIITKKTFQCINRQRAVDISSIYIYEKKINK